MPRFARYLGIDYSGAQPPIEIPPPPSPRKYWTRRGPAEWLVAALRDRPPTLVGIDQACDAHLRP